MRETPIDETVERLVRELRDVLSGQDRCVATAESLTGGYLAAALSAGPHAERWYRGGIVAYQPEVKYGLLRTPHGPVVTAPTAQAMAASAAVLLGADYAVGVTGVGGPAPSEGKPAGTVYISTSDGKVATAAELYEFEGDPVRVLHQTICASLRALIARVLECDQPAP
ncbi:CinA family protein [Leucobacter soli]|uniref:Competence-damage inducible protein n=1 Tax=Leucobacter soli TaxID=2812850 RepID=A0A916JUI6_9MICO|nr:CinA family protein [Leucobacter soli]CAG7603827.1 Putative competence-damage inducible protein [Leucobacter soli]